MKSLILPLVLVALFSCQNKQSEPSPVEITGELKLWHKVEITIDGPSVAEYDPVNPFLDYRLEVAFQKGSKSYTVPGFFAADGNASETSADSGSKWKVRFRPDEVGTWDYTVSFLTAKNLTIGENLEAGQAAKGDGLTGQIEIVDTDKIAPDFRALGRVEVAGRYLKHAGSGQYFLKGGADSPENFLAYADFDQTYRYGVNAIEREGEANPKESLHRYEAHLSDWKEGDPTWQGGKGKAIIGGLNYLASKGMNSAYMLTMNIQGDGKDVWPYTDHNERYRFDCSKLDQWEVVFDHMEELGLMIHFVLQETENENLLDGGHTQSQRKVYLRELVARFGHHPAVTWNMGEENGPADWTPVAQTDQMRKDMANYLKAVNPYPNFVVVHTHSNDEGQDEVLLPLIGFKNLDGPSMQISDVRKINDRIGRFVETSSESEKPWVVCLDEIGQHWKGVLPDEFDPAHDTVRHHALWGSLMAGAAGVEWYFGYRFPHNDLECEDFRSRDKWWDQTRIALEFFRSYLPFDQMIRSNELAGTKNVFCFAKANEVYALYVPRDSGPVSLDLRGATGMFSIDWYNPRSGGDLQKGDLSEVDGGKQSAIGLPPADLEQDWVALVKKINN